ncbi:NAD(P)-binding domain-containing protein, partial [Staphylococcus lugdunensis]
VLMWGKNNDSVNELNTHHMNKNYLKDAKLDETIQATTHLEEATQHADVYLMALPTKAMREVVTNIDKLLTSKKTFIHVAKGIENGTFKR